MAISSVDRPRRTVSKKAVQFAATVNVLRQQANLTLDELAARSGLSTATLSKIENSKLSPTYDTLLKLAHGLRVDVARLFNAKSSKVTSPRRSITRRGAGRLHLTPQYQYEMFCSDIPHRKFTPLLATITARSVGEFVRLPRHEGEEFVYVLSGDVELHTEHFEPTRLRQGDGCYFDSTMGHACISVGNRDAVVLWIASNSDRLRAGRAHRD